MVSIQKAIFKSNFKSLVFHVQREYGKNSKINICINRTKTLSHAKIIFKYRFP